MRKNTKILISFLLIALCVNILFLYWINKPQPTLSEQGFTPRATTQTNQPVQESTQENGQTQEFISKNLSVKITLNSDVQVYETQDSLIFNGEQSIERFEKNPSDSLLDSISKTFDLSKTACYPKFKEENGDFQYAYVTYRGSVPNDELAPDCGKYTLHNEVDYFLYNKKFPDRFYRIRHGQSLLAGETASTTWSDAIEIIK